jgi:hypothetical protein
MCDAGSTIFPGSAVYPPRGSPRRAGRSVRSRRNRPPTRCQRDGAGRPDNVPPSGPVAGGADENDDDGLPASGARRDLGVTSCRNPRAVVLDDD